eukprot:RCo009293
MLGLARELEATPAMLPPMPMSSSSLSAGDSSDSGSGSPLLNREDPPPYQAVSPRQILAFILCIAAAFALEQATFVASYAKSLEREDAHRRSGGADGKGDELLWVQLGTWMVLPVSTAAVQAPFSRMGLQLNV